MGRRTKDKTNPMIEVIDKGAVGVQETTHPLGRLWRLILYTHAINGRRWHMYVARYQERMRRLELKAGLPAAGHTAKGAANIKGNLTRRLAEPVLSWNLLMRGISVLEFDSIKIEVHLTKGRNTQIVDIEIDNDELNKLEEEVPATENPTEKESSVPLKNRLNDRYYKHKRQK